MLAQKKIKLAAVVAMSENNVIGHNNQLLWKMPADLQHFKMLTTGHPIIMGRKTYLSIGRALPNRQNIVLTQQPNFQAEGILITHSKAETLQLLSQCATTDDIAFVIGGAEIYRLFLSLTDTIYLTLIHAHFDGDTYFPSLSQEWETTERIDYPADTKNPHAYSFMTLRRKASMLED